MLTRRSAGTAWRRGLLPLLVAGGQYTGATVNVSQYPYRLALPLIER